VLEEFYFAIASEYGRKYISCPCILKKIIHSDQPLWIEIIQENEDLPGRSFWIYHD